MAASTFFNNSNMRKKMVDCLEYCIDHAAEIIGDLEDGTETVSDGLRVVIELDFYGGLPLVTTKRVRYAVPEGALR